MKAWEEKIRKVVPYVPGEQPQKKGIIKLNTNENPYPPAPGVEEANRAFSIDCLRKYPDPTASDLVNALADRYGVRPEQIFTGVGSDDVLAMAFLTFFHSDKPIFFPDITYSFYDVWADLFRIPYERKPLDANFHLNPRDYDAPNGGIVFPNPNAPTGVYEDKSVLEDILQHNADVIVIVDEAYVDFAAGGSAQTLLDRYENLLIVQTFSKSRSMAGMRIGFAIGAPVLIRYLNDAKYSFNSYTMSHHALRLGVAVVSDEAYFQHTIKKIVETREWTKRELAGLGFVFPDSQANFVFASHPAKPACEIFAALKERGIYVRYFPKPRIDNFLRISIGTQREMEQLLQALREIVSDEKICEES